MTRWRDRGHAGRRTDAGGGPAPPELVQAARRIDWRFLLPDPDLGRTACLGRVDPALVDALRSFAASAHVVGAGGTAGPHDVDLVVAGDPSRRDLARAAELLRPGGWIYVELSRAVAPAPRRRLRSPGAVASALAAAGFDGVQAHWHYPDAERREGLVALDDVPAVRHVLARRPRTARAAAREAVARLLLAARLFAYAVPSTSVIARRAGDRAGGGP